MTQMPRACYPVHLHEAAAAAVSLTDATDLLRRDGSGNETDYDDDYGDVGIDSARPYRQYAADNSNLQPPSEIICITRVCVGQACPLPLQQKNELRCNRADY